jgi:HEAT repeat protein
MGKRNPYYYHLDIEKFRDLYLKKGFNSKDELAKKINKKLKGRGEQGINPQTVDRWVSGETGLNYVYYFIVGEILGKQEVKDCVKKTTTKRGDVLQEKKEVEEKEEPKDSKTLFDTSNYLQSIKEHLEEELNQIHYVPRELKIVSKFQRDELGQYPLKQSNEDDKWTVKRMLKEGNLLTVIGEPGVGKTTLSDKLNLNSTKNALKEIPNGRITIYIDLGIEWKDEPNGFKKNMLGQASNYKGTEGINLQLSEEQFNENEFIFLFDHLENVQSNGIIDINKFVNGRKNNSKQDTFIFFSRINFDKIFEEIENSTKLIIKEFEINQVKEILYRMGIKALSNRNETNARLLDFGKNPYRLKMLIKIFKDWEKAEKEIEFTREVEIYDEFINVHSVNEFLDQRTNEESIDFKKSILAHLAFRMLELNIPRNFSRFEAIPYLKKIIRDENYNVDKVMHDIEMEGLIVLSNDRVCYSFAHDTLSEFFCAWHLAKNIGDEERSKIVHSKVGNSKRIFDPLWERIIVFCASLMDDATSLINEILNGKRNPDDVFFNNLYLAAECTIEVKENPFKVKIQERVLDKILEANWFEVWFLRKEFMSALASIGNEKAIEWLLSQLDLVPEYDQGLCINLLNGKNIVGFLISKLESERRSVRLGAVITLKKMVTDITLKKQLTEEFIQNEEAIGMLIQRLKDEDKNIRRITVSTLGHIAFKEAEEPLIKRLEDIENEVRIEAVRALKNFKSEKVIKSLVKRLDIEYEEIREEIAITLREIGSDQTEEHLFKFLDDKVKTVRKEIIKTLSIIGSEKTVSLLIDRWDDEDFDIKGVIASALGSLNTEQAVEFLIQKLEGKKIPWQVIASLDKRSLRNVVKILIDKLDDEDEEIRSQVFSSLAIIGSEETLEALMDKLDSEDEEMKDHLLFCLVKTNTPILLRLLTKKLEHVDGKIRRNAVGILAEIDFKKAIDLLIYCLEDKDKEIRKKAVTALGEIKNGDFSLFRESDILDWPGFCSELILDQKQISPNPGKRIWNILHPEIRFIIENWIADTELSEDFIITALNKVLETRDFYQEQDYSNIDLPEEIQELLSCDQSDLSTKDIQRLNRLLIEATYPDKIAKLQIKRVIESLINKIDDEDGGVRSEVLDVLGIVCPKKIMDLLIEKLDDKDPNVRCKAVSSLANIRSDEIEDLLIERLEDEDSDVQCEVIDALNGIGSKKAINLLVKKMDDMDLGIRLRVVDFIINVSPNSAINQLIKRLEDITYFIQFQAINALGVTGSEEAVEPLIKKLEGENDMIRSMAAANLGIIGSKKAIKPLIKCLEDKDNNTRVNAAIALGKIGSKKAVNSLERILNDDSLKVRDEVIDAFRRVNPNKTIEILCQRFNQEKDEKKKEGLFYLLHSSSVQTGIKITKEMVENDSITLIINRMFSHLRYLFRSLFFRCIESDFPK